MKCLIVEDDLMSRRLLKAHMSKFADCDIAVTGKEAVESFKLSTAEKKPYNLICLDIMLPEMDGQQVLKQVREIEKLNGVGGLKGVKVIMTTALGDKKNVADAFFKGGCESYLVKPIMKDNLVIELKKLGLIKR
jgi:two-component system, chemotaxis family, chemotaxis protein CheY